MRAALLALALAAPVALDDGHVDFGVRVVGGELRAQVKDSTQPGDAMWRELDDVHVRLDRDARTTIPAGDRFAFLGPAGAPVWLIPQVQKPGVVWLGWNTQELSAADVEGPVTWRLTAVDGPGAVAVFQTGSFGQVDKVFDSGDGLPDARDLPLGTHAHGNWSFTRPGAYALHLEVTARRAGAEVERDARLLRVEVDDPATAPPPPPGGPGTAPQPPGADPPPQTPGAAAPLLTLRRASVHGRRLSLRIALRETSRVRAMLRRRGRIEARTARKHAGAGERTVTLRLDRRPRAGRRYELRVSATAAGRTVARTRALTVRDARGR